MTSKPISFNSRARRSGRPPLAQRQLRVGVQVLVQRLQPILVGGEARLDLSRPFQGGFGATLALLARGGSDGPTANQKHRQRQACSGLPHVLRSSSSSHGCGPESWIVDRESWIVTRSGVFDARFTIHDPRNRVIRFVGTCMKKSRILRYEILCGGYTEKTRQASPPGGGPCSPRLVQPCLKPSRPLPSPCRRTPRAACSGDAAQVSPSVSRRISSGHRSCWPGECTTQSQAS